MSLRDKIEHAIQNQPCMVKDLKAKFGGDRAADRKVMEALDELVHDAVVCQKSGVFFTARSGRAEKALLCKVVKLGKNFAFVMLEDESGDIFIPGRFTRGAMPGDSVLVEKFAHPRVEGSDEGEILAVLEQKNDMVGTVRRIEGRLKFVPDDCPAISMTIQRDCEGGAKDGDKVAVEILQRGTRQEDHRVGVSMRFGSCEEAKRCAKALLYAKDIHTRFPEKVRDEAKKVEDIPEGSEVTIANDSVNAARGLLLLQSAGLIKLDYKEGANPTPDDIVSNPKNLKITELEASQTARSLPDVGASVINVFMALDAGLNPKSDAIYIEPVNEQSKPYYNIIVSRAKDKDNATYKKIVDAYRSDDVKKLIDKLYKGAVIPLW